MALKRKDILTHGTAQGVLRTSVLNETSQSKKDTYYISSLTEGPEVVKFREIQREWWSAGLGKGRAECLLNGKNFVVHEDKRGDGWVTFVQGEE